MSRRGKEWLGMCDGSWVRSTNRSHEQHSPCLLGYECVAFSLTFVQEHCLDRFPFILGMTALLRYSVFHFETSVKIQSCACSILSDLLWCSTQVDDLDIRGQRGHIQIGMITWVYHRGRIHLPVPAFLVL